MLKKFSRALLAAAAIASPPAMAKDAADVTAFVIGADRSFNPHLPPLDFASTDAARISSAMQAVGAVVPDHVVTLANPTVADYKAAARRIEQLISKGGAHVAHKLIFYFSGHADDSGLHLPDGLISKADLHGFLASVAAATKVVILDSCFSGALSQKGATKAAPFEIPQAEYDEPTGTIFLTAASAEEGAFESKSLRSGIFTHHLLNGLYGQADANRDGIVTVDELYQYVYRETRLTTFQSPQTLTQRPEFVSQLQGRGAVAVAFPARPDGGLTLAADLPPTLTITSAQGIQYFSVQKRAGEEKRVQLPAGDYRLTANDGDRYGQTAVHLAAKATVAVRSADLTWSRIAPSTRDKTKGEQTASLTAALGMHGGFTPLQNQGPYAEVQAAWPVATLGSSLLRTTATLSYYNGTIRNQDARAQNDSISGAAGLEISRLIAAMDLAPSVGLALQLGENYQRERWTYPDATRRTFVAWSPEGAIIGHFEIFLDEFGLTATLGKEAVVAETTRDGKRYLSAWIGALGLERALR